MLSRVGREQIYIIVLFLYNMIKLTFLGTSDAVPSAERNHTAILLTYEGENILIDCGEGTQRQFRMLGLNPCKITRILLTHKHADHSIGLIGLLKTMEISGYNKTLFIYGPRGIKEFVQNIFRTFGHVENYKIHVEEVSGKFLETKSWFLEAEKMSHGVVCNAYNFVKKGQIRIDRKKLKKSGLPNSEILKKLKEGKDISYNGKKYLAKNLTFQEDGKKISFILDTEMKKNIVSFAKNSDLLVCDSSYGSDLKDKAKLHQHLTASQAGEIAKKSKSKKLILTHISQRYEKKKDVILKEAKKIFKNSHLAHDLQVVEV